MARTYKYTCKLTQEQHYQQFNNSDHSSTSSYNTVAEYSTRNVGVGFESCKLEEDEPKSAKCILLHEDCDANNFNCVSEDKGHHGIAGESSPTLDQCQTKNSSLSLSESVCGTESARCNEKINGAGYECKACGQAFRHKSNLQKHQVSHIREKAYNVKPVI